MNIILWSFRFNEVVYLAKYAKICNVKISELVTFSKPNRHLAWGS